MVVVDMAQQHEICERYARFLQSEYYGYIDVGTHLLCCVLLVRASRLIERMLTVIRIDRIDNYVYPKAAR